MSEIVKRTSILGGLAKRWFTRRGKSELSFASAAYWEKRYSAGGKSGAGAYGLLADFKADVVNGFVAAHHVQTVIDFGCGDGNQLSLAKYPAYLGLDVSSTTIARCQELFRSDAHKSFRLLSEYDGETADLALSLDVIYHLVEDHVFEHYMRTLFGAANRYVITYASDSDDNRGYEGTHVRHRKFTPWIQENLPGWKLLEHIPNRYPYRGDNQTGSFSEFFIYEKA